jgi:FkbM family methyltransferase
METSMSSEQFVSYAQNFEDVMLWRALKHIQQGFYVDVGAYAPKDDSVTQAFYERGWRGINIEPMAFYYEALCKERPGDINLPFAVAATEREITLFEIPETGLSSGIFEFVQGAQSSGRVVVEHTVQALPLNKILEAHAHEPIHFLKIDVEGFEEEVLQGLDLSRWRPWIFIVEATIPNSSEVSYDSWEPILLSAAYVFVYFDGLNRFYVSKEHSELAASFAVPPNFFDHFITHLQLNTLQQIADRDSAIQELNEKLKDFEANKNEITALRSELEWARTDLSYLRAELPGARAELTDLRASLASVKAELTKTREDLTSIKAELTSANAEIGASRSETELFKREYFNILYSQSYRITAPMRFFYRVISKLRAGRYQTGSVAPAQNLITVLSPVVQESQEDEQYFLSLFQHEINKRSNS